MAAAVDFTHSTVSFTRVEEESARGFVDSSDSLMRVVVDGSTWTLSDLSMRVVVESGGGMLASDLGDASSLEGLYSGSPGKGVEGTWDVSAEDCSCVSDWMGSCGGGCIEVAIASADIVLGSVWSERGDEVSSRCGLIGDHRLVAFALENNGIHLTRRKHLVSPHVPNANLRRSAKPAKVFFLSER